jgi:hypothetical protein
VLLVLRLIAGGRAGGRWRARARRASMESQAKQIQWGLNCMQIFKASLVGKVLQCT